MAVDLVIFNDDLGRYWGAIIFIKLVLSVIVSTGNDEIFRNI
jgi:hypothetical protein